MTAALVLAALLQPQDPQQRIDELLRQLEEAKLELLRLKLKDEADPQKRLELIREEGLRPPFKSLQIYALDQASRLTQDRFAEMIPAVAVLAKNGERETALKAVDVLSKFTTLEAAQQEIQEASEHPRPEVRAAVATALRSVPTEAALAVLVALLGDPSPDVRRAAAIASAEHKNAGPAVFDRLKTEKDAAVRKDLIDGLGALRHAPAVDALVAELKQVDGANLWAAINALGKIGDPKAFEPLVPFLKSPQEHIRQVTIQSIGRLNTLAGREALRGLLADTAEDPKIRKQCAAALAGCGDPAVAHDVLLDILLAEADEGVREAVWKAMLALTHEQVGPRLQLLAALVDKRRTREAGLLCTELHPVQIPAEQVETYAPLGRAVADALFDAGELGEALPHYRNVARMRPPDAMVVRKVVDCYRAVPDLEAAAQFAMSEFKRGGDAGDHWPIGDLVAQISKDHDDAFARVRTIHELLGSNPAPPEETRKQWKTAYDEAAATVLAALPGDEHAQKRAIALGRALILPLADRLEGDAAPEEFALCLQIGNYIASTTFEIAQRADAVKKWRDWHDKP